MDFLWNQWAAKVKAQTQRPVNQYLLYELLVTRDWLHLTSCSQNCMLMKSISKDIYLNNIYFKGIENIEPAVKAWVNCLFSMTDGNDDDVVDIEKW